MQQLRKIGYFEIENKKKVKNKKCNLCENYFCTDNTYILFCDECRGANENYLSSVLCFPVVNVEETISHYK